jgi:hypothetical protein
MSKQKKRYCTICGKELGLITSFRYNPKNGKRITVTDYESCIKKDCNHGYHKFNFFCKCKLCGKQENIFDLELER